LCYHSRPIFFVQVDTDNPGRAGFIFRLDLLQERIAGIDGKVVFGFGDEQPLIALRAGFVLPFPAHILRTVQTMKFPGKRRESSVWICVYREISWSELYEEYGPGMVAQTRPGVRVHSGA
jgi:hypothetical protein